MYGYGKPVPKDGIFIHDRSIPDTSERNLGSREALRVKARDPATLPQMTLEQVDNLSNEEGNCVATYRGGVYNLTPFVKAHPGGNRIEMANGQDLEPFRDSVRRIGVFLFLASGQSVGIRHSCLLVSFL